MPSLCLCGATRAICSRNKACSEGSKPQDIPSGHKTRQGASAEARYDTLNVGVPLMSAPLVHIESSPSLPQEADVVVIGGGVVGVFTAYYLARRGVKVALLEKGRVAAEQSSRNWGWASSTELRCARATDRHQESRSLGESSTGDRGRHGFPPLRASLSVKRRE